MRGKSGGGNLIIIQLTKCITQLDATYATSPSPVIYEECHSPQAEFEDLATAHTTELLLKSKHIYSQHGDKTSRLLAHQLWQTSIISPIPQIQICSGLLINPKQINDELKGCYTKAQQTHHI